ncbi:uncharacterized protein ARMOST_17947 [Armillaria ostoyae]|uniref:Uncharacterized protein n=1 Tax=Armillaria ostoyae TaxID=47428 RepID=A0A284S0F4_ARMOS|nr:uncharacterized protein ARMOST_17947 [Armillaria ostoyae]
MLVRSPTQSDDLFSSARIRTFVDNIKGPKVVKSVLHFQVKTVFYMLNTFLAIYALAWTYRYNLISSIQCLNRQNTDRKWLLFRPRALSSMRVVYPFNQQRIPALEPNSRDIFAVYAQIGTST